MQCFHSDHSIRGSFSGMGVRPGCKTHVKDLAWERPVGGGLSKYTGGVCPDTSKRGVLGAGTARKRGGLRCGHSLKSMKKGGS